MNRTHAARPYALLLLVAAGFAILAAVLMPGPASAATISGDGSSGGRYPHSCPAFTGAETADRAWAEHVAGCGTELTDAQVATIIELRDLGTEGLAASVPARTIVNHFAAVLGDRTEAVTLWTATSVYFYGGGH